MSFPEMRTHPQTGVLKFPPTDAVEGKPKEDSDLVQICRYYKMIDWFTSTSQTVAVCAQ